MAQTEQAGWTCPECGQANTYRTSTCCRCYASTEQRADKRYSLSPASPKDGIADRHKRPVFLFMATLALFTWAFLIWEYHKWDAQWGPINVLVVTVLAAALAGFWLAQQSWFRNRDVPTRWRLILIPAIGFVICASAGIYLTEPKLSAGSGRRPASSDSSEYADRRSADYQYDYGSSRASDIYFLSYIFDFGSGVGDADVDEGCLVVLLVILVIALIIGSFFIPHFWVLATFLLMTGMIMVAYREWRLMIPTPAMAR